MKFLEVLKHYQSVKYSIYSLQLRQNELRELGGFPRTCENDGMPRSNYSDDTPMVNFVAKLQELDDKQKELETELDCVHNDLLRFTALLTDENERQVVEIKIFANKKTTWEDIAERLFYSKRSVQLFYKLGIEKLEVLEI